MADTRAVEMQFDGLIGPSHNYAGLSLGNVASAAHAGATAHPRAAALQGLGKMRLVHDLGVPQGFLPPQRRPNADWLRAMGFGGDDAAVCAAAWRADPALLRVACSASAMWTANAATVTAAPDSGDGRVHFSVANLSTMPHRAQEAPATFATLSQIFADRRFFAVHPALPASFGDEGAANHMRLTPHHGAVGADVFVYGLAGSGPFPARQDRRASAAVARRHGIAEPILTQQADAAIAAGAFHNDVVAVANESVLFAHEQAFADAPALLSALTERVPGFCPLIVPAAAVPLDVAVRTYLFNAQLLTLPDGSSLLLAPQDCAEDAAVSGWLAQNVGGNHPIHAVRFIDVRQSMDNGGGPACLRLRVPLSDAALAAVNPAYRLDSTALDSLMALVERHWPERVAAGDIGNPDYWAACIAAHDALEAWIAARGA